MGGCFSVLSPTLGRALSQACACFLGDGNYISTMEANLEALENTMQQLILRRNDLSRRVSLEEDKGLQRLDEVQGWISKVQDIESHVSELLKTKSTETQRLCLFGYCSDTCKSSFEYGKEVSKKLKKVQELFSRRPFEVLAEKALVSKVGKQPIKTTVGLDSMVEDAWKCLMDLKGTTLCLYGMGGVGKTTLLGRINNKFVEEVNVVIWVVVSKDLQIESIQNQILGRLRRDKEWKNETEEEKASSIYNILSREKYVLLLDDIWSKVDLEKIGVPPPTLDNGLKIVFTTRSEQVCKDMEADYKLKVDCLSSDEAWELFGNIVGENILEFHEEIHTLARKVVEKCCGLPLTLTVVGESMKGEENVHEWRYTLNLLNSSTQKYPGMEEKILPTLKVSYDGLEDKDVKSCFLYCSLFPEDYDIEKEKLIEYWICEGFINRKREEDGSSSQGHSIINSLVRAHLLMETEMINPYGDFRDNVKMHEVIREMALWITSDSVQSNEELHFVKSGGQLRNIPNNIEWEVVKRISLMSNQIEEISCCPNCPNLLSLLLHGNDLKNISGEFFRFMSALVVLDLSGNSSLKILPEEISTLSSLKYLNLSHTRMESLPVGLKGLNKLISLDLESSEYLESIDGIGTSLPNLQVLKLFGSNVCIDARVMEELQLLEHLEILTATIMDVLILERIQGLKRLANCIRKLIIGYMSAAVVVLNTVALSNLQFFCIIDCKISEIKIDWERSKESEELCTNSPSFKHLFSLHISELEGPKDLTWLISAQNLGVLSVEDSGSIEEILNREKEMRIKNMHPCINVPLLKLQSLTLTDMSELKRISSVPLPMPNLKDISIRNCPNLPEAAIKFRRQEEE